MERMHSFVDLTIGKQLILEHVKAEMRRRGLDAGLLVFRWTDHPNTSRPTRVMRTHSPRGCSGRSRRILCSFFSVSKVATEEEFAS